MEFVSEKQIDINKILIVYDMLYKYLIIFIGILQGQ